MEIKKLTKSVSDLNDLQTHVLLKLIKRFSLTYVNIDESMDLGLYAIVESSNCMYRYPVQFTKDDMKYLGGSPVIRWVTVEENQIFIGI